MRVGPACRSGKALKRRPSGLLGERTSEAQEGRDREAGTTVCREKLWRGRKTQESIGPSGPSGPDRDTDPRGEKSPEVAGHRDPLVLRAEERDVINGKRATAPKGVQLREGEKLCRVNPMSGSDPRDRKVLEGANRQEGEKP